MTTEEKHGDAAGVAVARLPLFGCDVHAPDVNLGGGLSNTKAAAGGVVRMPQPSALNSYTFDYQE